MLSDAPLRADASASKGLVDCSVSRPSVRRSTLTPSTLVAAAVALTARRALLLARVLVLLPGIAHWQVFADPLAVLLGGDALVPVGPVKRCGARRI